jgi:hypothetical protein
VAKATGVAAVTYHGISWWLDVKNGGVVTNDVVLMNVKKIVA